MQTKSLQSFVIIFLFSILITLNHWKTSFHIFDWNVFIDLKGDFPFQGRVLTFLIAKILQPIINLKILFISIDLISITLSFYFLKKTIIFLSTKIKTINKYEKIIYSLIGQIFFAWGLTSNFILAPMHKYYYPYDFPTIAFGSAILYLIVSGKNFSHILLLTLLSSINRETAVIYSLFFAGWYYQDLIKLKKSILIKTFLLFFIPSTIKYSIAFFLNNTQNALSLYEGERLRIIANLSFFSGSKADLMHLSFVLIAGGLWICPLIWKQTDQNDIYETKIYSIAKLSLLWFIPMLFVSNIDELRAFSDLIPLFSICSSSIVIRKFIIESKKVHNNC